MSIEPTALAAMDCSELERSIDSYLDGEFDDRERAEAEAHLAACPRCRALAESQGRLRTAVRAKLREAMTPPSFHAPAALRARVEDSLSRERRPLWRRILAPIPIATLAACAAGALVVLWSHGPNDALVEEAIRYHHRALPLEADAAALPGWFHGKLDFRAAPPEFHADGVRVEGGRLSNLREWPAAYIRYTLPRGQAGLFIVDDPQGRFDAPGREVKVGPRVLRVVNARGYNVAVWRQDEIVYSLVSELGESDLFQLVQTVQAEAGR
jgi:anti-sigma factor (TIGR02949 family)